MYYRVLGVERTATVEEIKKSYRKLAMQYHPDRNPGDTEAEAKFREATEAYQILSDPQKRQQFDTYGKVHDDAGFTTDASDFFDNIFGDVFSMFGGGGRRRNNFHSPRRGSNITMKKSISFEESIFGVDLKIDVKQLHACPECKGNGAKEEGMLTCPDCHGKGSYTINQGFISMQTVCHTCGGMGKVVKEHCSACGGKGFNEKDKKLSVKIPAGIENGMAMRLSGEGNQGANGGPSGDLILEISVKSHKIYKRERNNLILDFPLTFVDAILGKTLSVPMLDGSTQNVEVKAGTQFGESIVLKKQGVSDVQGRGKGDLIIRLEIMLPTKLNSNQKNALKSFQDAATSDMYKKSIWQKMKTFFS